MTDYGRLRASRSISYRKKGNYISFSRELKRLEICKYTEMRNPGPNVDRGKQTRRR